MRNVDFKLEGTSKLIITIDLTKSFGASKSGKSIIIASTDGNVEPVAKIFAGVNIYKKA